MRLLRGCKSKWKIENGKFKITQIITSPLVGEVCFPFETELKMRKQGEGSSRRVPFCERSEQNNFPFSTFNFSFKGGVPC